MIANSHHKQHIEHITWNEQHIATIIRAHFLPDETTFVTPDHYYQQTGFAVYPKDGVIKRHAHLPLQRHLSGTQEALLVRNGKVEKTYMPWIKVLSAPGRWKRETQSFSFQEAMA